MTWIALLAGCYLLGSISWSYLIVRLSSGHDVRTVGSGNAGATNVLRVSGALPGAAVLVLDIAKGAAAVGAARWFEAPAAVVGGAAVAVVLGHVFPLYHGFRGGKGVATATGALFGLTALPATLALMAFVVIVGATRYVSLGSMAGVALFPPLVYFCDRFGWTSSGQTIPLLASSAVIAAVIILRHRDNIRRLRDGRELKLGQRTAARETT